MFDVEIEEGILILFIFGSLLLAGTLGAAVGNAKKHKDIDSDGVAIGWLTAALSAIPWFLVLTGLFSNGAPLDVKAPEGAAWGFGILAASLAGALGLAAGYREKSEAKQFAIGFGVFTVATIPWFGLLVWLFNPSFI